MIVTRNRDPPTLELRPSRPVGQSVDGRDQLVIGSERASRMPSKESVLWPEDRREHTACNIDQGYRSGPSSGLARERGEVMSLCEADLKIVQASGSRRDTGTTTGSRRGVSGVRSLFHGNETRRNVWQAKLVVLALALASRYIHTLLILVDLSRAYLLPFNRDISS